MAASKAKDDPGAGKTDAPDGAGPVPAGTPDAADPAPAADAAQPDPAPQPSEPGPPAAAPVTAPQGRKTRTPDPAKTVEPSAAMRETPGTHVALVGHDGRELGPDDLFADPGAHMTHMLTSRRIYQQFRYPGTDTVTTQLLYPANARVTRDHAEHVKATLRTHAASGADGEDAG